MAGFDLQVNRVKWGITVFSREKNGVFGGFRGEARRFVFWPRRSRSIPIGRRRMRSCSTNSGGVHKPSGMEKAKRVLCLLAPGFEEIETVTPIDLLRRAGAEVVTVSLNGRREVTGRSGITVHADSLDFPHQDFDLFLLPGGPGVQALRADGRAAKLAASYFATGKLVAAICAAPGILQDAGLLEGRRFTAHSSLHAELPSALGAERVVEDGNLITSRGAGTALDFGLALVRRMFGPEKEAEIAGAIMA